MRSLKLLLRQPLKTLLGILLVAIAVASLCVSVGQTIAASRTEQKMNSVFQVAAFPAITYSKEMDEWVHAYAEQNPGVIDHIASASLVSAYVPSLIPDNYTSHVIQTVSQANELQAGGNITQYTTAALVVTLTEIGKPIENQVLGIDGKLMVQVADGVYSEINTEQASGVTVHLEGVVEKVIELEQGYSNPVGYLASMTLMLKNAAALSELNLVVGERYLVYTTTYYDDWITRNELALNMNIPMFEAFDMGKLTLFDQPIYESGKKIDGKYDFDGWIHGVTEDEINGMRKVYLTVSDPASIPDVSYVVDWESEPDSYLQGALTRVSSSNGDLFFLMGTETTPVYAVTEQVSNKSEEYYERYARPAIVHLNETVEEYLSSDDGILWKTSLNDAAVNNHSFPIIGVENLKYIPDFLRGMAKIVEGRDFTEEELKSGAKVCILSESLAQSNGLTVGDSVSVRLFEGDKDLPGQFETNVVNPVAQLYHSSTTKLEEAQSYTIVGLYRQDSPWGDIDENLYSFTPNTIFAPKTALPDWQNGEFRGLFRTILLDGRNMEKFFAAVAMEENEHAFLYFDNGYEAVAESLQNYQIIAGRVLGIGITVYSIMQFLFLLLYPAQQKKTLYTMECLGANRWQRMAYVQLNSLGILIPGTVLGTTIGSILWEYVVQFLLNSTESALAVKMEVWILVLIATAQLIVASYLVHLISIPLGRSCGIAKRS